MAEITSYFKAAEDKMEGALLHLDDSLAHIRAGKANVRILDPIRLDYYGSLVPLSNVATITTPDARTIIVQPWEKKIISKNIGHVKVLARGSLDKKLNIELQDYSLQAVKMIALLGGQVKIIK